jgi:ribosomal protein S18 acetylase RimI-like enzyme
VALDDNTIVGCIEMRAPGHISMLFVQKEHQRKGIASELLRSALEQCQKANPEISQIDVHSSPYAVKIYEKLGFIMNGDERMESGIRFFPRVMKLNSPVEKPESA